MELIVEWYLKLFKKIQEYKQNGLIKDSEGVVDKIKSLLYQLRNYIYDPEYLKESGILNELYDLCNKLSNLKIKNEDILEFIRYFAEEIKDIERKMKINPDEPFKIFRYKLVKVLSVSKHPEFDNLYITKVSDGNREYTVITNIKNVKTGEKRAIVFLPPKKFGKIISEAMFITEKPINDISEIKIENLRKLNQYFYQI